jgi:mono/diheme cytochrome c family protein
LGECVRRWLIGALVALGTSAAAAETLVERGAYLADVMTCHNCHTPRGPNGFDVSRLLSGGQQQFDEPAFRVSGANITPDKETGIGQWTDAQLKTFLVTGTKPDGVDAAPIMPTAFYPVLTPRDLDALVAYLRSIPAVRREIPTPEYRMTFAREKPPYVGPQMRDADMTDPLKRGGYLVAIVHCLECHTPRGPSGHDYANAAGKGGKLFKGPWGQVVSANITSNSSEGLGQWSDG